MEWKNAQVKFVGDNGYGFLDGAEGRVFFHKAGYIRPDVILHPEPHIQSAKVDCCKRPAEGDWVSYVEEKNDKGLMAVSWCYRIELQVANQRIATAPRFRIVYRRIDKSAPVCDAKNKIWVENQIVSETVYDPTYEVATLWALLDYKGNEMLLHGQFQLQTFSSVEGWKKAESVLPFFDASYARYFDDQSLFARPLDVVQQRKVA